MGMVINIDQGVHCRLGVFGRQTFSVLPWKSLALLKPNVLTIYSLVSRPFKESRRTLGPTWISALSSFVTT